MGIKCLKFKAVCTSEQTSIKWTSCKPGREWISPWGRDQSGSHSSVFSLGMQFRSVVHESKSRRKFFIFIFFFNLGAGKDGVICLETEFHLIKISIESNENPISFLKKWRVCKRFRYDYYIITFLKHSYNLTCLFILYENLLLYQFLTFP